MGQQEAGSTRLLLKIWDLRRRFAASGRVWRRLERPTSGSGDQKLIAILLVFQDSSLTI